MAGKKPSSTMYTLGVVALVAVVVVLAISLFFPMKRKETMNFQDPTLEGCQSPYLGKDEEKAKSTILNDDKTLNISELKRCMRAWWTKFGSNPGHNIIDKGDKKVYAYTGVEIGLGLQGTPRQIKLGFAQDQKNYTENEDFVIDADRVLWIPAEYKKDSKMRGFHDFTTSPDQRSIIGTRDKSAAAAAAADLCVVEGCSGDDMEKIKEVLEGTGIKP